MTLRAWVPGFAPSAGSRRGVGVGVGVGTSVGGRPNARGMAVISALLIVAAVALICAALIQRQSTLTREVQSEQSRLQARWLLRGGLDWGRAILRSQGRRNAITSGDQIWARPLADLRIDGGGGERAAIFAGRIEDEQGKYNLYNLAQAGRVLPEDLAVLDRLLSSLGLAASLAPRIAQRIARGQPPLPDPPAQPGGAPPVKLAAPAPAVQSIADLSLIEGIDETATSRLSPYLTMLPARTAVNVNTASAEVLAALIPGLTLTHARSLVGQRDRGQWFNDSADFLNRLADPDIRPGNGRIAVDSQWFLLSGQVQVEQAIVNMQALLHRADREAPRVLWMIEPT